MNERKTPHTYSAYFELGRSNGWSERESEEYALRRLAEDLKYAVKHQAHLDDRGYDDAA